MKFLDLESPPRNLYYFRKSSVKRQVLLIKEKENIREGKLIDDVSYHIALSNCVPTSHQLSFYTSNLDLVLNPRNWSAQQNYNIM